MNRPDQPEETNETDDSSRGQRITGYAIVSVALTACVGVGWIVTGDPTDLSRDLWGWLTLFLGAGFSLFGAFSTPFIGAWGRSIAERLPTLPARAGRILKANILLLPAGVIATVLVILLTVFVRPPLTAANTTLEKGDIVLYSAFDESPRDPRRILIDQWNQAHPDSPVRVEDIDPLQVHDRAVADARPGGAHAADVYLLDNVWMPEFVQAGYVRALNGATRTSKNDEFIQKVISTCRDVYGGRSGTWCLPLNTDVGLMYKRADLQGVPDPVGWDGYLGDAARQALIGVRADPADVAGASRLQAASTVQADNEEILTVNALEAMWAAGGRVVNADGRLVLNGDGSAVQFDDLALQGLQKLALALADRGVTTVGSLTANEIRSTSEYRSGQALYMRNWPVANDVLRRPDAGPSVPYEVRGLGWESVLGGQDLAIARETDSPRAAQAFLEFMASPSSQLLLFEIGGFAPVRPEAYANASPVTRPYAQDLRATVERARPRPLTPCYIRFSAEFHNGITRAIRNGGVIEPDLTRTLANAAACR